jgi:hypothetical protein
LPFCILKEQARRSKKTKLFAGGLLPMGTGPSQPSPEEAELLLADVDRSCAHAAAVIESADILLVITGAGFSADSGLAVYNDIARIEPYADRGLGYMDLCEPHWLESEPELFYGFWGACLND